MIDRFPIWKFGGRFLLLFVLLMVPWPAWRAEFARWFQAEARVVLRVVLPAHRIVVGNVRDPKHPEVDTQIAISDPREIRQDGMATTTMINLDSRSLGWIPQAMTLALLGAVPRWRGGNWKRACASLIGTNLLVATTIAIRS